MNIPTHSNAARATVLRASGRPGRHFARIVASLLIVVLLAPGTHALTAAITTPSNLAQSPLFVGSEGAPNVMFMLDDSDSMNSYSLPVPPGLSLPNTLTVNVSNQPGLLTKEEWGMRSAAFNPIWYNPSTTYVPWNDNNKPRPDLPNYTGPLHCGDVGANFCNANYGTGTSDPDAAPPPTFTEIDKRYRVDSNGSRQRITELRGVLNADIYPIDIVDSALGVVGQINYDPLEFNAKLFADLFTRPEREWGCNGNYAYEPQPVFGPPVTNWVVDPTHEGGGYYLTTKPFLGTQMIWGCIYVPNIGPDVLVPARYYVWDGQSRINDPSHYRLVEVLRSRSRDYSNPANRYLPINPSTGQVVSRADCAAGTWCTFEEEAQNYANWYTYYRTRLFTAIAVISNTAADFNGPMYEALRIGYGRINNFVGSPDPWAWWDIIYDTPDIDGWSNPGALVRGVRPFQNNTPERQQFFDWLFTLNGTASTPNREALDAAGRYFSRTDSAGPWGDTPGTPTAATAANFNACRRSYTMLLTDGEWTTTDPAAPNQPLIMGDPLASLPETRAGGTSDQTNALRRDNVAPIVGAGAARSAAPFTWHPTDFPQLTNVTSASPDGNPGTLSDVAMYYWNRDLLADTPNAVGVNAKDSAFWQHMSTYIIGYGINPTKDPQQVRDALRNKTPLSWNPVNTDPNVIVDPTRIDDSLRAAVGSGGDFFSAPDVNSLKASIKNAFSQFIGVQSTGTRIGATSGNVTAGDVVFSAGFTTQSWQGSVTGYDAPAFVNGTLTSVWAATIPAMPSRQLYTTLPSAGAATAFTSANVAVQNAVGGNAGLVDYLAGDRSREGTYRVRQSLLGDIINSSPRYVKNADFFYQFAPAAGGGGSAYSSFMTSKASRKPMLYVGANDGFLHAFDATTGAPGSGSELFAYAPGAVLGSLARLASPAYAHQYYVDGPVVEGDAWFGATPSWHTLVAASGGAGPVSLVALDVTDPTRFSASNVLWDLNAGSASGHLGHILQPGVFASTRAATPTYALVTGNGYESSSNDARLLVLNAQDGRVIADIKADDGDNSPNGLGGIAPVYDANRNIVAVYAGDKHGNLWKFDLSSSDPSQWRVDTGSPGVPLFKAGNSKPISAAPRVSENPRGGYTVTFGTGKLFENGDDRNTDTQSIYVIWDDLHRSQTIASTAIVSASLTQVSAAQRTSAPVTVNWGTDFGWKIDLNLTNVPGERVIATPNISGGNLVINSYSPQGLDGAVLCGSTGVSYLYQLNLVNAGGVADNVAATVGGTSALAMTTPAVASNTSANTVGLPPSQLAASIPSGTKKCGVGSSGGYSAIPCPVTTPLRVWRPGR